MTCRFVSLRRIAALSVAIALLATPIASAQSREVAAPGAAPPNTALLSYAAFARLAQPTPTASVPTPVVADSPRPSLLRRGTAVVARQAQAAPAQAPQQKSSWASRHPGGVGAIIVGAILGAIVIGAVIKLRAE